MGENLSSLGWLKPPPSSMIDYYSPQTLSFDSFYTQVLVDHHIHPAIYSYTVEEERYHQSLETGSSQTYRMDDGG